MQNLETVQKKFFCENIEGADHLISRQSLARVFVCANVESEADGHREELLELLLRPLAHSVDVDACAAVGDLRDVLVRAVHCGRHLQRAARVALEPVDVDVPQIVRHVEREPLEQLRPHRSGHQPPRLLVGRECAGQRAAAGGVVERPREGEQLRAQLFDAFAGERRDGGHRRERRPAAFATCAQTRLGPARHLLRSLRLVHRLEPEQLLALLSVGISNTTYIYEQILSN